MARRNGKGRLTHQYNPAEGVPTYQQYAWAVSNHTRGSEDAGGAIIHATPVKLRREYAGRIADTKRARGRMADDDRWNPAQRKNLFGLSKKEKAREAEHVARYKAAGERARAGTAYLVSQQDRRSVKEAKALAAAERREREAERKRADQLNRQFLAEQKRKAREEAAEERERQRAEKAEDRRKQKSEWAQRQALYAGNPAKFDRCVKAVQAKGGTGNAYAVCTAAGKRNPGRKRFWVVTPNGELLNTYATKKEADTYVLNVRYASGINATVKDSRKENPAAASAEAFEEFHGYPSKELVTVSQKVHRHTHLAAAGDLVGLEVRPIDGGPVRKIEGLGKALLTFNEAKNQLFVSGGDQYMSPAELKKFGIRDEHELQTLGKLKGVGYFTTKTHLGDEGGEAVYSHTFRMTNTAGRHVVVKIAREPDLIYRVLDQQFEFSGGSYLIRAEGIDK